MMMIRLSATVDKLLTESNERLQVKNPSAVNSKLLQLAFFHHWKHQFEMNILSQFPQL